MIFEFWPNIPTSGQCQTIIFSLLPMLPLCLSQEESLTFQGQLDSLEAEILKNREELHSLQVMNSEAQLSKESAKVTCSLLSHEITTCSSCHKSVFTITTDIS